MKIHCFCIYLSIKGSALSPFSPLGFTVFTEANLESEEPQLLFGFCCYGSE